MEAGEKGWWKAKALSLWHIVRTSLGPDPEPDKIPLSLEEQDFNLGNTKELAFPEGQPKAIVWIWGCRPQNALRPGSLEGWEPDQDPAVKPQIGMWQHSQL